MSAALQINDKGADQSHPRSHRGVACHAQVCGRASQEGGSCALHCPAVWRCCGVHHMAIRYSARKQELAMPTVGATLMQP